MKALKAFNFKALLFSYLAVSKVFYWIDQLGGLEEWGDVGTVLVNRLLQRDIMIVIILLSMFKLDDVITAKEGNGFMANVKIYGFGLVIYLALIAGYTLLMEVIFEPMVENWFSYLLNWAVIYFIISAFLTLKEKMKQKEAAQYIPDATTPQGQIALLETLCQNGVLSRDECDAKIEQCTR
jgi:uncharacterized membrane protein SirB2